MKKINSSNENLITLNPSRKKAFTALTIILIVLIIINSIESKELKEVIQLEKETIDINSQNFNIKSEEVGNEKSLDTITFPSSIYSDNELLFVSTLDGHIHAYSANSNKELWKLNLGKPLINSNVDPANFVLEQNAIIPGLDGNIYLYSRDSGENMLKKIEIPLKTLIDNSPFTLPNLSKYIFIGDKKSSIYTIDVNNGKIVSKFSNGEESLMHKRPTQSNNVMTIIRIDYTLICLDEEQGNQMWNVTVSEVMALQKGAKSEISIRRDDVEDSITHSLNQIQLANKLNDLIENNPNLNSIVSVHKYNVDNETPVKIYDVKPEIGGKNSDSNFIDFFNENYRELKEKTNSGNMTQYEYDYSGINFDRNFYHMLSDYLRWTKEKILRNDKSNKSILQLLIFKFWEMYYFEEFFFVYVTIIFILLLLIVVLITIIIKYIRRNNKLTRKYNRIRKTSEDRKVAAEIALKNDQVEMDDKCEDNIKVYNTTTALAVYEKANEFNEEPLISEPVNDSNLIQYQQKFNEQSKIVSNHKIINETLFKHQFDLGLKNYQIANQAMVNVKTYIDNDGSLVQEEQRVIKTKYESNSEVGNKIEELKTQLDIINKKFSEEQLMTLNNSKNNKQKNSELSKVYSRRQRVNSCNERFEEASPKLSNLIEENDEYTSSKRIRNNSTTNKKFELKFSFIAKQEQEKIEIVIKNNTSEKETELKTEDCYANQSFKELNLANDNKVNITSNAIQIYSNKKPKYKCKEYNIVNNESTKLKINTTYIDEDRLDKNFEGIEKIGQGGFGCVFKAMHKIDGWFYAIKMIELKVPLSKNLMEHKVIKEVKTMMKLNHKNVVRYTTCWFQLQIGRIESLIDASAMMGDSNTVISLSRSKSALISNNKNNLHNRNRNNKKVLIQICENEEKSSSLSPQGFNWGDNTDNSPTPSKRESIMFVKEEGDNSKKNSRHSDLTNKDNADKALSISFEKNREHDSKESISESENNYPEKARDDSDIPDRNLLQIKSKKYKEPSYKVYFFMQMEFCDGLSLNQYIELQKDQGLNKATIFNFFKQIVSGVNHIHKNNVIHRDLKPHNIFIFGKNSLKIGDFGLATELSSKEKIIKSASYYNLNYHHYSLRDSNPMSSSNLNITYDSVKLTGFVGTPLYQSPEQIDGLHYNEKVDIFAMGLILYEMCACFKTGMERRESLESLKNDQIISQIVKENFPIESNLILWMTNKKPSDRPSALAIMESEIFIKWKNEIDALKIE